jgi:hypothetical protein
MQERHGHARDRPHRRAILLGGHRDFFARSRQANLVPTSSWVNKANIQRDLPDRCTDLPGWSWLLTTDD